MDLRYKIGAAVAAAALGTAGLLLAVRAADRYDPYTGPPAAPGTSPADPDPTRRIALNTEPADYPRLRELGYDLVDIRPDPSLVAGIPHGMQALMWVGNFHCDDFTLDFDAFTRAVRTYGRDPRVYGWYLSDEPNTGECPRVAAEIERRADFLEEHAPGQVSFISLTDWPMGPVTPGKVNVDIVGLDPYPCRGAVEPKRTCDIGAIDRMVRMADRAGIPRDRVAPVLQAFGQECSSGDKQYWLPTEDQFRALLRRWDRLVPAPALEITYTWGPQEEWACPTLADASGGGHPDLQSIVRARNTGRP
ncbi:hypothetical protein [Actinomadura sp. WAC 06369]|uniref:hypothetical protein n=1 Tax=Actinomadura sp. WAC 06369 TaxID=2203193 RepID=UPI000F79C2B7|nr:hypothetical protein [Actinomadura sp. WAC 06369]RSN64225.1 hypothetical protein DMH08_18095 [Actinomadura sp. WAC 06369]